MDRSPDWNESWDSIAKFQPVPETDAIPQFLSKFLKDGSEKSALEVGCFPGGFIDYVGSKGYTINGIDTYAGVTKLNTWLSERGRRVGYFKQASLSEYAHLVTRPYYDVVMSLGLIEHFENFCEILYDHAMLCNRDGKVIIGAPNFASPFQRALHRVLDGDNFEKHVLESMYPKVWAVYLAALGFRIDYCGPVGRFSFWSNTWLPNLPDNKAQSLQQLMTGIQGYVAGLGELFNQNESGYVAVVATRTQYDPPNLAIPFDNLCLSLAQDLSMKDQRLSEPFDQHLRDLCR